MSFKLLTLIYWNFAITLVTGSTSNTTLPNLSLNDTLAIPNITAAVPVLSINTTIATLTTNITTALPSLPINTTIKIPINTTATVTPSTIPTTGLPSNVHKLNLSEIDITSMTITIGWKREVPSNKNISYALVVNIRISNSTYNETFTFNATAGLPGNHTFVNLLPYSKYCFTAYETFKKESGPESYLIIDTLAAAPSKAKNLQTTKRTEHAVEIKWDQPAMLNGEVVEFRITYTFPGNLHSMSRVEQFANKRNYTITQLYAFVNYTISVQEKTVAYGPPASITAETLKAIPFAPPRGISVDKEVLQMDERRKVKVNISWTAVPHYYRGDDYVSYIVSGLTQDVIQTNQTYIDPLLGVYTTYDFQIRTQNNFGCSKKAPYKFRTREAPPSKPRDVQVTAMRGSHYRKHYINMTWGEPEYLNGIPRKFRYTIRKCPSKRCKREISDARLVGNEIDLGFPPKRRLIITHMPYPIDLDAYSEYVIEIMERTCSGCWGDGSGWKHVITLPGEPTPPESLQTRNIAASSVDISWMPPLKPNGKIISYNIILRIEDTLAVTAEGTVLSTGEEKYSYKFEKLDSEKGYIIEVVAINEGDIRGDPAKVAFQTLQSTTWLFILIGCLVVVLIIVLILSIYLLVSRRRRQYKEVKVIDDIEMMSGTKSKVISMANFKNYCLQHHANSDHGFQQEYETLRAPVRQFTWEHSALACNLVKNRYSNIVAYDHSRVTLAAIEDDPSSTYINANYIDGYLREKQYIATQGPLPETIIDFWRMIWDENCPIIVMLTKLIEDNRLKCEQYWPEGKGMQYRDIVVTIVSVKEMTDMTVKVFQLSKINNPELGTRQVHHFHYMAWPDHGVPNHPTSMLSFIRHVMSFFPEELTAPIVVHCSAGVGRTGTFIAIEGCLRQMENENQVDIFGAVLRMRMQRNFMVQTENQFTFIYDALLDNAVCGNTEITPKNLVARIKYLNEQDAETGQSHFVAEFKRLESGFSLKEKDQFTDASLPENKAKNRFLNILPFDKNRIRLAPIAGSRQSDYINASIVDGFQQKHAFIATQAPLENTVVDFWRMVLELNVQIIVMLTKLEEKGQEKCYLYWPQAGTVSYGSVHVDVVNVRNQNDIYIIHDLRITNRETGKSWPVTHFLYLGWPEYHGSPDSGTDLMHFIGLVEKTQRSITGGGPTLVHCSGGVGRTGVFITVFNSVERLKAKNVVDVFQTTRALRLQRSAMVQTIDQYKFCYQCLKDYLDSFDLYANPEC